MTYKPVDTAIVMTVGPCIDDTDFKSLEEAIAYDAAGMDISLIVEKTDGTTAVTAITLTTGGTSDWTHKDGGYYEVEVTAAQNTEEGIAYLRGVCTGVLPFASAHYNIVKANVYDSWVKGTDVLQVDITQIGGDAQSATDLKDFTDAGYDPATNKVQGVVLVDTTTTNTDMVGTANAALAATALTDATWTDAKAAFLDHSIVTVDTNVDTLLTRVTAAVALASICTETRLAELDAANLITDVANVKAETVLIVADTNELQTDWVNGGRLDLILDIIAADTTTDIPALIAALNNISTAEVNTQMVDVLTIDTIADSYSTDGNQPTMAQAVLAILQMMTEKSITGTTLTVKKPDGSTSAMTFTLDSATTPTSITRAT